MSSATVPICDALSILASEADLQVGSGVVETIIRSRRDRPLTLTQQSLFSVLRVAEKQAGAAVVHKWLASYLAGDTDTTSTPPLSQPPSRGTSPSQPVRRGSLRAVSPVKLPSSRNTSPTRSMVADRDSSALTHRKIGTAPPPPQTITSISKQPLPAAATAVVAAKRINSIHSAPTSRYASAANLSSVRGTTAPQVAVAADGDDKSFSRSASGARTTSAPRVHTPVGERPSVISNPTPATRVAKQAPPSATNVGARNANGRANSTEHRSMVISGYATPNRVPRTATAATGNTGVGSTIAQRKAAGIKLRETWATQVTAASRTLGSLSIHHHIRVETLTVLQKILEDGSDELVRHALNSDDFFCVTCGRLLPLLNHQLQSVDKVIVKVIISLVALVCDAMGPLFANIMDTYFSRILWLLDCPAMAGVYEDISSHITQLVEKVRHERMLCHLIDHIRWLDRKGDQLPHSIEISRSLATAVHNMRDVISSERSKRMCAALSFQLLEYVARRACLKVQFSIDDLIHPNEYTLPYLDDLYISDEQRAKGLPAFALGSKEGSAELSCIVEIFRKSIGKREGVDYKQVRVHRLPSLAEMEDGEDIYDFGSHPLIRAYEFIAQHTGKGLQEVANAPTAVISSSPTASPQRTGSPEQQRRPGPIATTSAPPSPPRGVTRPGSPSITSPLDPLNATATMTSNGSPTRNRTTEIMASTEVLSRTITNDDFRHKTGQQTVERMQFVAAVANRIWDSLILPIVGETTRSPTTLPYAHHVLEAFLVLFPIHGGTLFSKGVGLEQRKLVARRLLDRTTKHMYNFPLCLREVLRDLSIDELGGSLDDVNLVTPMVDSPTTRLGQMHLRQATKGLGSVLSKRLVPATVASTTGGQNGTAASLMMADTRAASPNLFAMMGHLYDPSSNSRISLRAPSPKGPSRGASPAGSTNLSVGERSGTYSLSTLARLADPHGMQNSANIKIKTLRASSASGVRQLSTSTKSTSRYGDPNGVVTVR